MNNYIENEEKITQAFVERNVRNKELTAAITLFRHQCELKRIEEAIEANKPVPTQDDSKVKRVIIDNTVNAFRRMETQKLSEKKQRCQDNISQFKAKCADEKIELADVSQDSLRKLVESFFENDTYGSQKVLYAMILCLQGEDENNNYIFGEDTLADVSRILFDDETKIMHIKEMFYKNFREIAGNGFLDNSKYFLIGMGISLALFTVLSPVVLNLYAAGSFVLAGCLAHMLPFAPGIIGAEIANVTGMVVMGSVLLGGVALTGYGMSELIKGEKTKEAFRHLKPNDFAAILSMRATLLDFGMTTMDKEVSKKELDECLVSMNDWRSDAEYMLIVEKTDAINSKKKIQICNRFVNRLAVIAGV